MFYEKAEIKSLAHYQTSKICTVRLKFVASILGTEIVFEASKGRMRVSFFLHRCTREFGVGFAMSS